MVEYSGGSTGTSLAFVGAAMGIPITIVTSDAFSREKRDHMRALGAHVEELPSDNGRTTRELIERMMARAAELSASPGTFFADQFNNPDAAAGYAPMADEFWAQTSEGEERLQFVPVPAPSTAELQGLVQRIAERIAERIGRSLERSGLITRDIENAYLAFDPAEEAPINGLLGASITYRIATGPREGQKVFTLQTLPAEPDGPRREVAESSGFWLHAGIAANARDGHQEFDVDAV